MKLKKAYETLWKFQKWIRDDTFPPETDMPEPKKVGEAIDKALELMKKNLKK